MTSKLLIRYLVAVPIIFGLTATVSAKDIVHDSEYQLLLEQHGDRWAAEDKKIEKS